MASRMTEREKIQGRLFAAHLNGGALAATPQLDGRYTVTGRAGDRYTVIATSLDALQCDCKAGQSSVPC